MSDNIVTFVPKKAYRALLKAFPRGFFVVGVSDEGRFDYVTHQSNPNGDRLLRGVKECTGVIQSALGQKILGSFSHKGGV